jgi:hypothetical protein
MTRYHGVFANRSKLRPRLPSPPPRRLPEGVEAREPEAETTDSSTAASPGEGGRSGERPSRSRRRLSWAALLHRVLFLDALSCLRCGGRRKGISLLSDPTGGEADSRLPGASLDAATALAGPRPGPRSARGDRAGALRPRTRRWRHREGERETGDRATPSVRPSRDP